MVVAAPVLPQWSDVLMTYEIRRGRATQRRPLPEEDVLRNSAIGESESAMWRLQRLSEESSPPPAPRASTVLTLLDVRSTVLSLVDELGEVSATSHTLGEWISGASRVLQRGNALVSIAIFSVILCLCLTLMLVPVSRS